ncbi:TPA: ABC transporter substrate-binding protein [Methanosarcina acetivorans]|uniref:Periplasmic binding protein n=2 Tax=Methanosarcina acetivorans TaxID=2214 RepID=Q8TNX4_METAC|nr:ABC transporter substrate-binding protein [Methanosarcina acetivorans]AAM05551.1 periplasmic binding protein [Methanosarcina acetivorans C2A]HIH93697.1 ABC transporter substrate-binding protein [Methanosarcina acetivorans]
MNKNNSILIVIALIILLVAGVFIIPVSPDKSTENNTITVTDLAGRTVSLKVPAERVVLGSSRDLHEFAAVEGENFSNKIVGWGPDLRKSDKDTYDKFGEKYPEIKNIPEVGYYGSQDFSIEKVVSLKPDLVIFPMFDYDRAKDDLSKFEQAGIPVVFTDFYQDTLENSTKSITLLGKLLGKEKRAKEITDFYDEQTDIVYSRLSKINKTKPKVYIESGWKGASEYGRTYSSLGWGPIVDKAGGDNIARNFTSESATVAPEFLIDADPDIIIITGSNWVTTPDSVKLGYYANQDSSKDLLKAYLQRPGWDSLQAVENQEVYSIFHTYDSRIYSFAGLQILAKWFYPEEFSDVDPEAGIKEFHARFMPIDYSGTWMLDLT